MSLPWHVAPTPQARRRYLCCRAPGRPAIDGRLDKPFWECAPWSEDFVDIEGDVKPRPTFRTRFKMVWDDECLYVGAEMEEPHVWGTLTEHDSIVYHDNDFEVFLNPTGDNHNYYEVEINALGTIFDLFLPRPYRDGGPADHDWDVAGLRKAVHVRGTLNNPKDTDIGWSTELAIPWKSLDRHGGAAPKRGDQWRVNFSRVQWDHEVVGGAYQKIKNRPEHNWVWSPQGIVDMHRPEQWGYLQFGGSSIPDETVRVDPTEAARDLLHQIYYLQRAFRKRVGRYAGNVDELARTEREADPIRRMCEQFHLQSAAESWTAEIRELGSPVVKIRDDSLVSVSL